MNRMEYFLELYGWLPRAGPGDDKSTTRAFDFMTDLVEKPRVLDVGCGPGKQTLTLAGLSGGKIFALDLFPSMLKRVEKAARAAGLAERISPVQMDMRALGFKDQSFDVIWSEGAIYIMGFEVGLETFRRYLKRGGYIAVSEPVWLTPDPPAAALKFWEEYPAIDTVSQKLERIRGLGFEAVGHFVLPPSSWTEEYYTPLDGKVKSLETVWQDDPVKKEVLDEARQELEGYKTCSNTFSYGFFVMKVG